MDFSFPCVPSHLQSALLLHSFTLTMICQRCLRRLAKRNAASPSTLPLRPFSQSTRPRAEAATAQTTTTSPTSTSTSGVQPLSTPLPKSDLSLISEPTKQASKLPKSSVAAGTVLKGLNFLKNKQDPVALEDHEYPAWLWTALQDKSGASGKKGAEEEGDLFCTSIPSPQEEI